ncbi:MAG TPA: saccharopine dehydrogenase C-terminal domain-containing protein, partial [Ferruginibacter sp.]|nr:saccharopine dehydrogenase C-terminal domain-containing protein [Ferruginibacter sp.]
MKTIVLIGAGKSATVLIDYLIREAGANNWKFIIADSNRDLILSKTNNSPFAEAVQLDVTNEAQRSDLIQRAHVVISMMPPALHFLIAKDCVEYRKHLLTASYLDDKIRSLRDEINDKKLLFLCEMGLDPGIDHMSAMQLIDSIKARGGTIHSFKSHCGGLVAPESDDNPWHYKISWNPRNIVLAGQSGAVYKENNETKTVSYEHLFDVSNQIAFDGLNDLAFYPNRDSLSYIATYKLPDAATF